jgi:hypothetical protein
MATKTYVQTPLVRTHTAAGAGAGAGASTAGAAVTSFVVATAPHLPSDWWCLPQA